MICLKEGAVMLALTLTATDIEPARLDICFEEREHCVIFEQIIVRRFRETSNGKVSVASSKCRRVILKTNEDGTYDGRETKHDIDR